jgi:thymidylate synthase
MRSEDNFKRQKYCMANPASWDPIYQKSPVHMDGEIHKSAMDKALKSEKAYLKSNECPCSVV